MRIFAILPLLMLLLAGCGAKNTETAEQPADKPAATAKQAIKPEPVGTVVLTDGSTVELTEFKQGDPVLIHISGKLNGRTSTLIRMTREDDIRTWKGITFESPDTFTIVTRSNKEFPFANSSIYIGGKSEDVISFITKVPGESAKEVSVPKSSIKLIGFTPLREQ